MLVHICLLNIDNKKDNCMDFLLFILYQYCILCIMAIAAVGYRLWTVNDQTAILITVKRLIYVYLYIHIYVHLPERLFVFMSSLCLSLLLFVNLSVCL